MRLKHGEGAGGMSDTKEKSSVVFAAGGKVVPVMRLRLRLGVQRRNDDSRTGRRRMAGGDARRGMGTPSASRRRRRSSPGATAGGIAACLSLAASIRGPVSLVGAITTEEMNPFEALQALEGDVEALQALEQSESHGEPLRPMSESALDRAIFNLGSGSLQSWDHLEAFQGGSINEAVTAEEIDPLKALQELDGEESSRDDEFQGPVTDGIRGVAIGNIGSGSKNSLDSVLDSFLDAHDGSLSLEELSNLNRTYDYLELSRLSNDYTESPTSVPPTTVPTLPPTENLAQLATVSDDGNKFEEGEDPDTLSQSGEGELVTMPLMRQPTWAPTFEPTEAPTTVPTQGATEPPTEPPTKSTLHPTASPTRENILDKILGGELVVAPTDGPTTNPANAPTSSPTKATAPTSSPTTATAPTSSPTKATAPTSSPTKDETIEPDGSDLLVPPAATARIVRVPITPFEISLRSVADIMSAADLTEFNRLSDEIILLDWQQRKLQSTVTNDAATGKGSSRAQPVHSLISTLGFNVETEVLSQKVVDSDTRDRFIRRKLGHAFGHTLILRLRKTASVSIPSMPSSALPESTGRAVGSAVSRVATVEDLLPTTNELDTSIQVTYGTSYPREAIVQGMRASDQESFQELVDINFKKFIFDIAKDNNGNRAQDEVDTEGGLDGSVEGGNVDAADDQASQRKTDILLMILGSVLAVGAACAFLATVLIYIRTHSSWRSEHWSRIKPPDNLFLDGWQPDLNPGVATPGADTLPETSVDDGDNVTGVTATDTEVENNSDTDGEGSGSGGSRASQRGEDTIRLESADVYWARLREYESEFPRVPNRDPLRKGVGGTNTDEKELKRGMKEHKQVSGGNGEGGQDATLSITGSESILDHDSVGDGGSTGGAGGRGGGVIGLGGDNDLVMDENYQEYHLDGRKRTVSFQRDKIAEEGDTISEERDTIDEEMLELGRSSDRSNRKEDKQEEETDRSRDEKLSSPDDQRDTIAEEILELGRSGSNRPESKQEEEEEETDRSDRSPEDPGRGEGTGIELFQDWGVEEPQEHNGMVYLYEKEDHGSVSSGESGRGIEGLFADDFSDDESADDVLANMEIV